MYETILYHTNNKICTITLNRPEKRNAFNAQLVNELKSGLIAADTDAQVKIIILKGEGEVFSAGADLAYLQSLQQNSYEENLADSRNLMELYRSIYLLSKPVIAQVEGHAIAGGCGLVTVCDFAFAVPEAQFGYTEVKIGFVPAIVMVFLLRKVNERYAKELLLTGKLINADKAAEAGLINAVTGKENINEYVLDFANNIITNCSSESLRSTKQMIAAIQEMKLEDALQYASEVNAFARNSEDCKHGIESFLAKKRPEWK